jgi:hypothetical protein
MAETSQPAAQPAAVPFVLLTTEAQQRQQLAAEIAALRQNPPDRVQAGGLFQMPDGSLVDAHGKPAKPQQAAPQPAPRQFSDFDDVKTHTLQGGQGAEGPVGQRAEGTSAAVVTGTPPTGNAGGTPLAADFPSREALAAAGLTTRDAVQQQSDEALTALPGIGPAAVKKIRAALAA